MIAKNFYYVYVKKKFGFGENRHIKSFKGKCHNHYTKQPCDVTAQKISL